MPNFADCESVQKSSAVRRCFFVVVLEKNVKRGFAMMQSPDVSGETRMDNTKPANSTLQRASVFVAEDILNHIGYGVPAVIIIIQVTDRICVLTRPDNKGSSVVLHIGVAIQFRLPFFRGSCLQRPVTQVKHSIILTIIVSKLLE